MDALSTAFQGMTSATNQLTASASRVEQMSVPGHDVDLGKEMADQLEAKQQFTASVQVMRIANEMWRTLMDAQES